jgi:hypothetical protein
MALWVLALFAALGLAGGLAWRWPALVQTMPHGVTLILTLGSLAIYRNVAFGSPSPQPAFWFLVDPVVSCLLIAIVALITFIKRRILLKADEPRAG